MNNTMNSVSKKIKVIGRNKIVDSRGWFLKVINGYEENLPTSTGEVYLTCAKSGESKGGHYHPIANEWFTLVTGECILKLVDIETNDKMEIVLDDINPQTIFVPNNIAHIFENTANDDFILLAYSDLLYNPLDTIPYNNF